MSEEKKSYLKGMRTFIFRSSWGQFLRYMTDAEAGKLIKAIFEHTQGKSAREYLQAHNAENLQPFAGSIISELEASARKYRHRIMASREELAAATPDEYLTEEDDCSFDPGEDE